MADATTSGSSSSSAASSSTAPTEVAVSDVVAHMQSVTAAVAALVTLINSKPQLYPGGLPISLSDLARQASFLGAKVTAATPASGS